MKGINLYPTLVQILTEDVPQALTSQGDEEDANAIAFIKFLKEKLDTQQLQGLLNSTSFSNFKEKCNCYFRYLDYERVKDEQEESKSPRGGALNWKK